MITFQFNLSFHFHKGNFSNSSRWVASSEIYPKYCDEILSTMRHPLVFPTTIFGRMHDIMKLAALTIIRVSYDGAARTLDQ